MITLYGYGRAFGLPDTSPFVMKTELLLKIAGLPYEYNSQGLSKAPKGKLPYINDDGVLVADSMLIRFHIEQKYGFDFNQGVSGARAAVLWAAERMTEEHLYHGFVHDRWLIERNFNVGPVHFFDAVPALIRPLVIKIIKNKMRKTLKAQGMGRHSADEIYRLCIPDIGVLASILGDAPYFGGDAPCGADATFGGFLMAGLCPVFETPLRTEIEKFTNLVAYRDRMLAHYFADLAA